MPYTPSGVYYPSGAEMTVTYNQGSKQYIPTTHASFQDLQALQEGIFLANQSRLADNRSLKSAILTMVRAGASYATISASLGPAAVAMMAAYLYYQLGKIDMVRDIPDTLKLRINEDGNFESEGVPVTSNATVFNQDTIENYTDIVISDINTPAPTKPTPVVSTPTDGIGIQIDQTVPNNTNVDIIFGEDVIYSDIPDVVIDNPTVGIGTAGEFPDNRGHSPVIGNIKPDILIPPGDFINTGGAEGAIDYSNDYVSSTLDDLVGLDKLNFARIPGMETDYINRLDLPQINPVTITFGTTGVIPGLRLSIKTRAAEYGLTESNRLRKDRKPVSGMLYLSMLRLVNKTWGRVSEMVDFYNVFMANMYVSDVVLFAKSINGQGRYRVTVDGEYKLSDLPVNARAEVLMGIAEGDIDTYRIDIEGLAVGLIKQEMSDIQVGLQMGLERDIMRSVGMESSDPLNLFNYGNVSTWANRVDKLLEEE